VSGTATTTRILARRTKRSEQLGSNALALGSDATDNRRGMLLGTPHFPWIGSLRFFQFHVTVPGQMDVMGGSLSGFPFINIGFNKDVAWSHTVDKVNHFSIFELKLDPANLARYVYRRADARHDARDR
jgi:acyl-homoserine-lactone acylase